MSLNANSILNTYGDIYIGKLKQFDIYIYNNNNKMNIKRSNKLINSYTF